MSEPEPHHRLRITILTQFFDPEPVAIPGMPLAKWLADKGHQVQVVTGFPNYPGGRVYGGFKIRPFRKEVIHGVHVLRVMLYPSHDRSAVGRVLNYLSFALSAALLGTLMTRKSDVTYVYHPPATVGLPAMLWKGLRKQPFVFHIQDVWPESVVDAGMIQSRSALRLVEKGLSYWCNLVYSEASAVAVISPTMKTLIAAKGVAPEKISVVANWADEELFYPMSYDGDLARSLGLDGCFNVIYAGNLGPYQGLDTALRAAARVRHLERFRLSLIGVGQAEEMLRSLADELQLTNVHFFGRIPYEQMGAVTNLASMLLVSLRDLPFFKGTIPAKTQVALCCGRPLILAVRGDASRIVESANAGLICPPEDERALAAAFERGYAMSRADLDAMGSRGREYYQEELSLMQGAGRLEELLREASERRSHS